MTDIDAMLAQLARDPVHPGLATIDAAVLDEIAARAAAPATPGLAGVGLAALIALVIGVAGSALPGTPARAASISPLGTPAVLAPSTLLGAE
ncbi:hypothetical protein SAMN06295912_110109 [Sphingomonas laterariae]|uniref:Uncharacterized protein n=1 Tax=Edaphosphingomonas laterariae TaxID=861865 RepID=A0A239FZ18_9SPHN|nr:hypothetical protein [Sphingomonas laterariae]SNS62119.1 hypothetical protein SAMN06295912_110109 [Sphingomonas laterariae]